VTLCNNLRLLSLHSNNSPNLNICAIAFTPISHSLGFEACCGTHRGIAELIPRAFHS
jgi:hypothetical protein